MAIKGKYSYRGLEMDEAYLRIDEIHGGKFLGWTGVAKLYYNKETAKAPGTVNALTHFPIVCSTFRPDENPYPVLYAQLKTDERFKDFVDA